MHFEPEQVYLTLRDHGINAHLVAAGNSKHADETDPAVIELDDDLAVLVNGTLKLVQDVEGTRHTRGKYTDMADMIDWIKAYQALNR